MADTILRSTLEAKLTLLQTQLAQVIAQANAIQGAVQFLEAVLKEAPADLTDEQPGIPK